MKLEHRVKCPDTHSRPHLSVFWKGVRAAEAGDHSNPYKDLRCGAHDHIVTGARGYRNYWRRGHEAGMAVLSND